MGLGIAGLGSPVFREGEKGVEPLMLLLASFLLKFCLSILLGRTCTYHHHLMGGKGGSKMRTGDYFTVKDYTKQSIIFNMISWGKRHAIIWAVYRLIRRTCTVLALSTGKYRRHAQARIQKQICGSWAFPFPFITPPRRSTCRGCSHWSWCVCWP